MNNQVKDGLFTSRELRDALARFATGVTIVTATDSQGDPVGMTASSFNSVSMDPPLVLWSVTKSALSATAFKEARHFAVHILASNQVGLSNLFAQRGSDKFAGTDFTTDENRVPILSGAAGRFDCRQWAIYDGGDHWIVVGEVLKITTENAEALIFCDGSYATASPLRQSAAAVREPNNGQNAIDGLLIYNLSRAYHQVTNQFHDAVHESGLTVPEWRILASLNGQVTRTLPELSARTFVTPEALIDLVNALADRNLCLLSGPKRTPDITGTVEGHDCVQHLFALGREQEQQALGGASGTADNDLTGLNQLLQQVIENTNVDHD